MKIEVEKSGLEDKIKIGPLSTIQLETERHIVEIFDSRSSVEVDLHHIRGPKGGEMTVSQFNVLMAYLVPNLILYLLSTKHKLWASQIGLKATIYL